MIFIFIFGTIYPTVCFTALNCTCSEFKLELICEYNPSCWQHFHPVIRYFQCIKRWSRSLLVLCNGTEQLTSYMLQIALERSQFGGIKFNSDQIDETTNLANMDYLKTTRNSCCFIIEQNVNKYLNHHLFGVTRLFM